MVADLVPEIPGLAFVHFSMITLFTKQIYSSLFKVFKELEEILHFLRVLTVIFRFYCKENVGSNDYTGQILINLMQNQLNKKVKKNLMVQEI